MCIRDRRKMENFNKEIWETFGDKLENVNTLRQKADTYNEETNKQMDSLSLIHICVHSDYHILHTQDKNSVNIYASPEDNLF